MACESRPSVVLLCGLEGEGRILRRWPGASLILSHGNPRAAGKALVQAVARHPPLLLVSFGVAGGLATAPSGTLIVPERVIDARGRAFSCDPGFRKVILDHIPQAPRAGDILGVDLPVTTARQKRQWHAESGAVAVDMESHLLAACAARNSIPFIVLRAIADSSDTDLPDGIAGLIEARGRIRRIARAWIENPALLGEWIRLGRGYRRALLTLRRAARPPVLEALTAAVGPTGR